MLFLIIKKSVNNIFCIVINNQGKLISYTSCGITGLKGPAKVTPYAAELVGKKLGIKLRLKKIRIIDYLILSIKLNRKVRNCLKGLYTEYIKIKHIVVLPKIAHNGLRKRKKKRR